MECLQLRTIPSKMDERSHAQLFRRGRTEAELERDEPWPGPGDVVDISIADGEVRSDQAQTD